MEAKGEEADCTSLCKKLHLNCIGRGGGKKSGQSVGPQDVERREQMHLQTRAEAACPPTMPTKGLKSSQEILQRGGEKVRAGRKSLEREKKKK